MDIKYIFCDVDGTLVKKDNIISGENLGAIDTAYKRGVKFVFSTGRTPSGLNDLFAQMPNDDIYALCGNGALLINGKKEILFEERLSSEQIKWCADVLMEEGVVNPSFAGFDEYYYLADYKLLSEYCWYASKPIWYRDIEEFSNYIIYKVLFFAGDVKKEERLTKRIEELSGGSLTTVRSGPGQMEFVRSDLSKGRSVVRFMDYMGVPLGESICLGDNYNDLPMMVLDNYRACPNNAVDEIKERCHFVSGFDYTEDAVADIIYNFILK